jgi:hypothetical protein
MVRPLVGAMLLALAGCAGAPPAVAPSADAKPAPAAVVAPRPASARGPHDAFVLLSGGGTPLTNNYSQYLQARSVETYFARRYPAESTWVFFGIGNREGEPPVLADARKELKRDNLLVESWLPGVLPRNRPATRESFLKALREEILPIVQDGGTLFLFIGDHGSLSRGAKPESVVTMWQLKQNAPGATGWSTDNKEELSVTDLRAALADGLGRGRVVFCMTQCHSGGFHFLSVPREIAPPAAWFTVAPPAAPPSSPFLPIAGFTATDEESLAAGCEPDPDPERWAGYERFAPESLLGRDLFTLEPIGPGLPSFAEAHENAILVDRTIDKPRATSEQFLERWAVAIEKLAANPQGLTPAAADAVRAFTRAVDTGRIQTTDAEVRAKAATYARFTARLTEQNTAAADLLLTGTRSQLEQAIGPAAGGSGAAGGRGGRGGGSPEVRTAWRDVVRPVWKAAVTAGQVKTLPAAAVDFEKRLLTLEDGGRDFMTGAGNPMLNETYWRSGYAFPQTLDRTKAEAVAQWAAERRQRIGEWARGSSDEKIRAAAEILVRTGGRRAVTPAPTTSAVRANVSTRPLSRKTAAERVLFYRRTLAAWACLVALDERDALAQLKTLIEIERTPLPPPAAG